MLSHAVLCSIYFFTKNTRKKNNNNSFWVGLNENKPQFPAIKKIVVTERWTDTLRQTDISG